MSNYIIPIIAAGVVLLILAVLPLKMGTRLLVKVVIVSLLIFVLTYLLYTLYPLYVAGAGFIFLLFHFSYLISRQQEFASKRPKVYLPTLAVSKPKQETAQEPAPTVVEKTLEPTSLFGSLDQEGIDALMKATADDEVVKVDEVQREDNKELAESQLLDSDQDAANGDESDSKFAISNQKDTANPDEQAAIKGETVALKLTIEDLNDAELETLPQASSDNSEKISSQESDLDKVALSEINSFEKEIAAAVDYEQEETELAGQIESSLEDFRIDREPLTNKEDIEENTTSKETDDSLVEEVETKAQSGSGLQLIVKSELELKPVPDLRPQLEKSINQYNQLFDIDLKGNEDEQEEIFEGRNRDVILAEEVVEKEPDKETFSKQTNSKDSDLKASILKKRSKLFAELEDDL